VGRRRIRTAATLPFLIRRIVTQYRYSGNVGRPKKHDERTAAALLAAAERTVEAGGLPALSVRGLAADVGTTARAVYSLFGSKDGLVTALGARGFGMLAEAVEQVPVTEDPTHDLVEAGAAAFRGFVLARPALFSVAIQHPDTAGTFREEAAAAFTQLEARIARLHPTGLGGRSTLQASVEFHALCEGLAAVELRGQLPPGNEELTWRAALGALVTGFAMAAIGPTA